MLLSGRHNVLKRASAIAIAHGRGVSGAAIEDAMMRSAESCGG